MIATQGLIPDIIRSFIRWRVREKRKTVHGCDVCLRIVPNNTSRVYSRYRESSSSNEFNQFPVKDTRNDNKYGERSRRTSKTFTFHDYDDNALTIVAFKRTAKILFTFR